MKEIPELLQESRHPKNMLVQVAKSFYYAFDGLFYVMLTQRNMRFHFCMALWVVCFAVILKLPDLQKSFLFMIISFVFAMEVLNTCIENLTNLLSPDFNKFAKIAKDTAAAAVLVVSIGSLMAAGYLLIGPFFHTLLNPEFWTKGTYQILAVSMIVGSVLGFWLVRALRLPMFIFLLPSSGASAFAITHLGVKSGDWLASCAMFFFSFLLFNSLSRRKTSPLYPLAGHVLGGIAYITIYYLIF
jgi:diacylglycerol kinase (ATP)